MRFWTRGRSRRADIPMCDSPRDTLPLPAEITRRILFFVSEPTITYDGRKRTYKYDRPRNLHHPPGDIKNARLVCKTFADLGAEFLFQNLIISADHRQLAHVKEIAEHKRLCKAVRSLYYDSRTSLTSSAHDDDDDSISDSENDHQWGVDKGPHEQERYYHEQEDILTRSLDTECLRTALATTLTAVTRVRCKPRERFHHRDPGDVSSPKRNRIITVVGNDGRDARPLYHLAAALTSVPAHHIRTLSLAFDITLLADAKLAPARFASLRAALGPVTNLTLAIRTSDDDYRGDDDDPGSGLSAAAAPSDRFARYAEAFGTHISSTASLSRALLADPATLAALVDATSPALHRFKLNLSADGRRRSGGYAAFRHDDALPLSCYLGSAASDGASTRWPALRYLYLGCVGLTQDELVPFLLARRRTLAFVEFDRVTLHRGQWCVVGAVVLNACPTWRWAKMSGLRQVERRRDVVDLPVEVVEAVREVEEEEGRWSGEKEGSRRVRWDECYFAEEDGSSTLFGGVDPETEGPGYGNPV